MAKRVARHTLRDYRTLRRLRPGFYYCAKGRGMITDWNRIDALVDKLAPEMIAVRWHLHAHPEPSGAERQTAQFLAERLRADGLEVRSVADDRGLLVAPPRARMGSRLGHRADTDALLIHE